MGHHPDGKEKNQDVRRVPRKPKKEKEEDNREN
jgi:hypothetical protein